MGGDYLERLGVERRAGLGEEEVAAAFQERSRETHPDLEDGDGEVFGEVNEALLSAAPDHAIVLHCLPAYRGSEISEGVMETHADVIFTEADNRLHFQRTLLSALMADGGIE